MTAPLIPFLAFGLVVPRAARVAMRFAAAAVFCTAVRGVATFFGGTPKSARTSA